MKTFVLLVLSFFASFFAAKYWYLGWFYYGLLPAPPSFLRLIWPASGEEVYNRTFIEMLLVAACINAALILYLRRK